MHDRSVTVFGGTGFLGRCVVQRLHSAGWRVHGVARRPGCGHHPQGQGIEYHAGDVRDEKAVARLVQGVDAVVNAVSLYVETAETSFRDIHAEAAERLAGLAAGAGVERLVHVSGIGADPASGSPYIAARGEGEQRVRAAFPHATVLRPSVLFGPNDAFVSALELITRLPVVPMFGKGNTRLQPVYVEDVASAVVAVLEQSGAAGGIFELGGGRVYSYREAVEAVLALLQRRRPLVPVPFGVWKGLAMLGAWLPNPPLTRDQVSLMQADNIVGEPARTFHSLGIMPASLEEKLPECLGLS